MIKNHLILLFCIAIKNNRIIFYMVSKLKNWLDNSSPNFIESVRHSLNFLNSNTHIVSFLIEQINTLTMNKNLRQRTIVSFFQDERAIITLPTYEFVPIDRTGGPQKTIVKRREADQGNILNIKIKNANFMPKTIKLSKLITL